ncbi:MAG: hypothetical protein KGM15_08500 [Pseudomonadota bacterium]|nr:hypothetical protein [Pseudomonadota bacterium]
MNDWSLSLAPQFPTWAFIALALAAALAVGLTAWMRPRAAPLRALVALLLLFFVADPSLKREDRKPLKDVVAVVLDRSGSNRIGERAAQTEAARAELARQLAAMDNVEAHFVDTAREDPDNKGTELFAALGRAFADTPPERIGGAILVTDGIVHDIPAKAEALGFRAPLHALITGHAGERDRRLELIEAPRFGIVGKSQTIALRVLDSDDHGEPALVTVKRDGLALATREATIGERIDIPAPIDHAGDNIFELEVAALPGELTAVNNKAVVTIDGVRDKLRVLLVSGEPHPGERMWRNLLKSDANVDLVHFTILRPPDKSTDGTPINELSLIAFPVADLFGRKIKDFDLIIFDRYSTQAVLPQVYLDNIVRYVRNGGALLLAVGPEFETPEGLYNTPLGEISPARPTGDDVLRAFRPEISPDGAKHPVTRGLAGSETTPPAWGGWFRAIGARLTSGVNIMQAGTGTPLLALSRVEKGRVALLLSDQIWLWARGYDGGGPHLDLLRRLAHWLMKEPELEEEALRARAHGQDVTVVRQSLKPDIPPATLTGPDGAARPLALKPAEPGLSLATVHVEDNGLYRASDGEHIALVNVGPENPLEFQEVVSTSEHLRALTEATGGSARRLGDPASLRLLAMRESPIYAGAGFLGVKRSGASALIGVSRWPLAQGFAGLAVLLGALVAMWLVESGRRWWRRG